MPADPGSYVHTGGNAELELWKSGTYAHAWFADAKKETSQTDDQARRREIIFAVCAVESYLFEWVRDKALNNNPHRLNHYFPVNFPVDRKKRFMGIVERWNYVIEHLHEDGTITGLPNFGEHYWEEFRELVDFRNGLVHGRASRPDTDGLAEAERPEPTPQQLAEKAPGWAVKLVVNLITKLHDAVGTTPPEWITVPRQAS
jgi:hypothetical protein